MTTGAKALVRVATQSLCNTSQQGTTEVVKSEKSGNYELSVYAKGEVTPSVLGEQLMKLRAAFPSRKVEFFDILAERIVANGFTDDRLRDAVNRLIDNFSYKEFNISDVIGFDKKIRLYTYAEVCDLVGQGSAFTDFKMREIGSRKFWVKIVE